MVVPINRIVYTSKFEHEVKKVTDKKIKDRLEESIRRIIENPEIGKPLRYALKGERTIRISPFRLIYAINGDSIISLRFEHRSEVYG
jgi:mRNA-degrading endonuclease RelE of RelBE toxin-antitoxin system